MGGIIEADGMCLHEWQVSEYLPRHHESGKWENSYICSKCNERKKEVEERPTKPLY